VELEETLKAVETDPVSQAAPELADILATLPDLRPVLESLSELELAELFDVFELDARWNHTTRR
jgi:hypothetical protein